MMENLQKGQTNNYRRDVGMGWCASKGWNCFGRPERTDAAAAESTWCDVKERQSSRERGSWQKPPGAAPGDQIRVKHSGPDYPC